MNEQRPIKSDEPAVRAPATDRPPPRGRAGGARGPKLATWIWIAAGVALALALAVLVWPRPAVVQAAAIDRGVVTREVVDEGVTRIHDVFVVAAPVGGELQRVELEAGDSVARGQAVAVIRPAEPVLLDARLAAEARAAVAAAEATLRAAEAGLQLEQRNQQRVARLHADGFASQAALDTADAALRSDRAAVAARAADLRRARAAAGTPAAGARTPIPVRSPAAGRVLRVIQESESIVAPGAALMEVGDPASLEIVADFLSQDAVLIDAGAPAFVESWGGRGAIPARVFRVEPYGRTEISALGVEEQRVNVIAHLQDPGAAPALGHGYRVDLRVVVSQQADALRVPVDALVRDGAGWAVFRIENGRARLTRVDVGESGERHRAVRSGLKGGDQVVLFPGDALKDGARVRVGAK